MYSMTYGSDLTQRREDETVYCEAGMYAIDDDGTWGSYENDIINIIKIDAYVVCMYENKAAWQAEIERKL